MLTLAVPWGRGRSVVFWLSGVLLFGGAVGCGSTSDSLGEDRSDAAITEPQHLLPLSGPANYPNIFVEVLGLTDATVTAKLDEAYTRLFYGDATTEAIYYPNTWSSAYIYDTFHNDVRTEGIGWGMMVSVQLGHRFEFDRLWTYAQTNLRYRGDALDGYFASSCDTDSGTIPCADPFGHQQMTMALIFAHDRWGSTSGIDYETNALQMLDIMRKKEEKNAGLTSTVTNMFEVNSHLVYDIPDSRVGLVGRPSVEMPAYYELWAQATGDEFWSAAAVAARAYLKASAHATTGLLPRRAAFDIVGPDGSEVYVSQSYRAQLNMVIDTLWFSADPWQVEEANRLVRFFASEGLDTYGKGYSLDGTTCSDIQHDPALVATNGGTAQIATAAERTAFLLALWDMVPPSGESRYYSGLIHLLVLLSGAGQFRVL